MSCNATGMLQLTALLIQHTPVSDIHVKKNNIINPGPRHFFRREVFIYSHFFLLLLKDSYLIMTCLLFLFPNLASDLIKVTRRYQSIIQS